MHYEKTARKYQSSKQVKDELKRKIKGYSEEMNVYPLIKDKTLEAIENAERIEKIHVKNGQAIDSEEANPHTSVYKVVEEINKRNKT